MRVSEDQIRLFNDSLDRCVATPRFLDVFYERFIGGSETVAAMFAGSDMRRQRRMLRASLYTAMLAADGNRPAIEHLEALHHQHRRLGIEPEHYDLWQDCLIASVRKCDGHFDLRVDRAWREVLAVAIRIMRSPAGRIRGGNLE